MSIRSDYKKLRQETMEFNARILEVAHKPYMNRAAELLGLMEEDDKGALRIVVDDEEETDILMHFAQFDVQLDGKTALELFAEQDGLSGRDLELIDIYKSSYWAPYRIKSMESNSWKVHMVDLLTEKLVTIIDISLSQCHDSINHLMVMRYFDFGRQRFTTGVSFPFYADDEEEVLEIFQDANGEEDGMSKSEFTFVEAYDWHASIGIGMNYEVVAAPRKTRKRKSPK